MSVFERNNVNVLGGGSDTLLFAHGFGCDQNMWRGMVPAFRERHRVVLFDHVGAGRSDLSAYRSERYASLASYARDVLQICDALASPRVHFIGHSVGAMMGVLASNARPGVFASLTLVAPSPCYVNAGTYVGGFTRAQVEQLLDSLEDNYLGWSSSMAATIMGNPQRPQLAKELENSFCRTDPAIARDFARVTFLSDTREDLPKVRVPTLVLQCQSDPLVPPAVGDYVHSQIPNSRLVQLEATGHCPHLSAPAETRAALHQFLRSLAGVDRA